MKGCDVMSKREKEVVPVLVGNGQPRVYVRRRRSCVTCPIETHRIVSNDRRITSSRTVPTTMEDFPEPPMPWTTTAACDEEPAASSLSSMSPRAFMSCARTR